MDMKNFGIRAVNCAKFRPMNGMLMRSHMHSFERWRMDEGDHNELWDEYDRERWYLDLSDAASRGCLLEVVRNAWCDQYAFVYPLVGERRWAMRCDPSGGAEVSYFNGESEVDVLVQALEAAP